MSWIVVALAIVSGVLLGAVLALWRIVALLRWDALHTSRCLDRAERRISRLERDLIAWQRRQQHRGPYR